MNRIEQSIIRTLCYQKIFDTFPSIEDLYLYLITDFIISRKDFDEVLKSMTDVTVKDGYVCFREDLSRLEEVKSRYKSSKEKAEKAKNIVKALRIIPWMKMIGISGAVAANNAPWDDDIDLFFIVSKDRIWMARTMEWGMLKILGVRRNTGGGKLNNKICPNFYLSEDNLALPNQDVFTASEIARLIPLIGNKKYTDFVYSNDWIKRHMANFWEHFLKESPRQSEKVRRLKFPLFEILNIFLGKVQGRFMASRRTTEVVCDKELRFHPHDKRPEVLDRYESLCKDYLK